MYDIFYTGYSDQNIKNQKFGNNFARTTVYTIGVICVYRLNTDLEVSTLFGS